MKLKECAQYIAWIGILFFIIGRLIPKKWLCYYKFPFRTFRFEEDGRIYKKLRVHDWQNKIPDMSKIFKKSMEPKKAPYRVYGPSACHDKRDLCGRGCPFGPVRSRAPLYGDMGRYRRGDMHAPQHCGEFAIYFGSAVQQAKACWTI